MFTIDLCAVEEVTVHPQRWVWIDVGLTWQPVGVEKYFGVLFDSVPMSEQGLFIHARLIVPGPIKVCMMNHSFVACTIAPGDQVARLIALPSVDLPPGWLS